MSPTVRWRSHPARHQLLAAAAELFARRGYAGTTVEAVANEAGANKALISYHFGGKERLYRAVWERLVQVLHLHETGDGNAHGAAFPTVLAAQAARHPPLAPLLLRQALGGEPSIGDREATLDALARRLAPGVLGHEGRLILVAFLYHLMGARDGEPLPDWLLRRMTGGTQQGDSRR